MERKMKPLTTRKLDDEIILNFSQTTAIRLAMQRMIDSLNRAEAARGEYQQILDTIAIEAGAKKEELTSWQLNSEGTKFIKQKTSEEKKKEKSDDK
jgi:hypothetical protein